MNKKAQTARLVFLILLLLGALIIGIWLFARGEPSTEENYKLTKCRTSISFISAAKEASAGSLPAFALDCEAFSREINDEDPKVEIMRVATELSNCWYKTYEEENLLGKRYALFLDLAKADYDVCVVCANFTVAKQIPVSDIVDYLNSKLFEVTSWRNDRIFLDISGDTPVRVAETMHYGTGNYLDLDSYGILRIYQQEVYGLEELVPGNEYFIVSLNAAKSVAEDYNMIFVVGKEDLGLVKCDIPFYQIG